MLDSASWWEADSRAIENTGRIFQNQILPSSLKLFNRGTFGWHGEHVAVGHSNDNGCHTKKNNSGTAVRTFPLTTLL